MTWFRNLRAPVPFAVIGARRPADVPRVMPGSSTSTADGARCSDPYYLVVVPYVPPTGTPSRLRLHPRVPNPFRAFPRRSELLVRLLRGR